MVQAPHLTQMRAVAAQLAVAVALLLSACGDDGGKATPTSTVATTTSNSSSTTSTGGSTTTTELAVADRQYNIGDCVNFAQRQPNAPTEVLPCAQPHLIEITGAVQLDDHDASATFPTDDEWVGIYDDRCGASVVTYLGAPIDPVGRFALGGLQPSRTGWAAGDRELWCGIILRTDGGDEWPAWQGSAKEVPQAAIRPPGTCLREQDAAVVEVACSEAHRFEVAGSVDLSSSFGATPPGEEEQNAVLAPACETIAETYLGHPLDDTIGIASFAVLPESWQAGRRAGECALTRLVDDEASDSTGSLKP